MIMVTHRKSKYPARWIPHSAAQNPSVRPWPSPNF